MNVRIQWIQFTRYFIESVVVEAKQIVSRDSNMILTRQTCGWRLGMAAVSKRRAIAFYFSVRICYMFLISKCKCRGKSDPGLYMTSVLAKRMPLCSADFQRILRLKRLKIQFLSLHSVGQSSPRTTFCLFTTCEQAHYISPHEMVAFSMIGKSARKSQRQCGQSRDIKTGQAGARQVEGF